MALAVAFVGLASGLGALAAVELAEERGWELPFQPALLRRALLWGLWVLLAWPLTVALVGVWRRVPWPGAVLLSALAVPATVLGHHEASEALLEQVGLDRRTVLRDVKRIGEPAPESALEGDGESEEGREWRSSRRGSSEGPFGPLSAWIDLGLVLTATLGGRAWLLARERERQAAELSRATHRLQAELATARLDRLTAQLRPHVLFNTLHAVGGLVREDRKDEALQTLAAVSDLLRTALDPRGRQTVPLAQELAAVAGYLAIASIRLGDRLVVNLHVAPGCERALLPVLMLLPLVENAVVHGAEPRIEPTTLNLEARREQGRLVVQIDDDGPGFPAEVLARGVGAGDDRPHVGLANCRSRLDALYGPNASLELSNGAAGGARVRLALPWCQEEDDEDDDG